MNSDTDVIANEFLLDPEVPNADNESLGPVSSGVFMTGRDQEI